MRMPQPLPENPYLPDSPRFHAYERCLQLERSAENASHNGSFSPQMRGRILGYMMREAPTSDGCDNVQKEIASCETDEALHALAQVYAAYLFRLSNITAHTLSPLPSLTTALHTVKKAKGRTPGSSSHPSRDETQETILLLLDEAPKSNSAVKKLALTRDNYRCVVTGAYDGATYKKRCRTDSTFQAPALPQFTQAAHIFPDLLNQDLAWPDNLPGKKADYLATAWAVVEQFGQVNVITESLNGPNIHRVENTLTMCFSAHELFDNLELWFEATGVPNTYKICSNDPSNFNLVFPPVPPQVTLQSTTPLIPLPKSDFLRIHAACARVAHLSGAAEYLETVLNEWEERPVLASDGGSADTLRFLLARAVPAH